MKIYVPELENYDCYVVQSEGVIRAYESVPTQNSTVNYRDYYINNSYIYRDGSQSFSQYSTVPICLSSDVITNNAYYRTDVFEIFILVFLFLFVAYFLISKCLSALFLGWRK